MPLKLTCSEASASAAEQGYEGCGVGQPRPIFGFRFSAFFRPSDFGLRFLAQFLCALSLLNIASSVPAAEPAILSLAGQWRFQLDREDAGERERWCDRRLEQLIRLPGALQNQGFGDDITVDTPWVGDVGLDRWKRAPQYDKYRQPGHIKVPFFLQPQKHYVGAAWYQREFELPAAWQGQRVMLTLERPHWESRVWVDGRAMGTNDSLSTPHVYDLAPVYELFQACFGVS